MKIQFCSDLHLEFTENTAFLQKKPLKPVAEYLALTGDISYRGRIEKADAWFYDWCSDNYEQTWIVAGNHEFYDGSDISILEKPLCEEIKPNVFMLNNTVLSINGVNLLFTSLLSKISDPDNIIIRMCMNDFRRISFHDRLLSITDYNHINGICIGFLEEALDKSNAPSIIFTHHVPSAVCNSAKQNLSPLNEAFTNSLDGFIQRNTDRISHWVFGHNHKRTRKTIGKTVLVSNPFGYMHEHEHKNFDNSLFIECGEK